jgi:hypothetical protein
MINIQIITNSTVSTSKYAALLDVDVVSQTPDI